MKKKLKKTGVALLVAGLTVTGTGYAFANGIVPESIDSSQVEDETTIDDVVEESTETVNVPNEENTVKEDEADVNEEAAEEDADEEVDNEGSNKDEAASEGSNKDEAANEETDKDADEADKEADQEDGKGGESEPVENELPKTPEGYKANNLVALGKAHEKVQNTTAKDAIKRNMERSVEKWENKQAAPKAPEQPAVKEKPVVKETPAPVKKEKTVVKEKAPQAQLNAKHVEQKKELIATQKAERKALKVEKKQKRNNKGKR